MRPVRDFALSSLLKTYNTMKNQTYESPRIEWCSFVVEGGFQVSQVTDDPQEGKFEEEDFEF